MSSDSVPSTMPPNKEYGEEEEWSGERENEEEVLSGPSNKECNEIGSNEDGEEAIVDCEEDRVEEPKKGMAFDTPEEAFLYYSSYAKGKGFAVAKRTSRKGKDGKLTDIGFACSRAGNPRVRTSNPLKPRPQTKIGCQAHVTVLIHPDGKWRLNRVVLEHNHEHSPGKARFFKSNRKLDEHVKRKLEVNDQAGIKLNN